MAYYNWWDNPTNTGYYKGIYFALIGRDIEVKTGEPTNNWHDDVKKFIKSKKSA